MSDWRTDIANMPKDGTTVVIPIEVTARAYWCKDLETWVLCWPLHVESVADPTRFRLSGAPVPAPVEYGAYGDMSCGLPAELKP